MKPIENILRSGWDLKGHRPWNAPTGDAPQVRLFMPFLGFLKLKRHAAPATAGTAALPRTATLPQAPALAEMDFTPPPSPRPSLGARTVSSASLRSLQIPPLQCRLLDMPGELLRLFTTHLDAQSILNLTGSNKAKLHEPLLDLTRMARLERVVAELATPAGVINLLIAARRAPNDPPNSIAELAPHLRDRPLRALADRLVRLFVQGQVLAYHAYFQAVMSRAQNDPRFTRQAMQALAGAVLAAPGDVLANAVRVALAGRDDFAQLAAMTDALLQIDATPVQDPVEFGPLFTANWPRGASPSNQDIRTWTPENRRRMNRFLDQAEQRPLPLQVAALSAAILAVWYRAPPHVGGDGAPTRVELLERISRRLAALTNDANRTTLEPLQDSVDLKLDVARRGH